ncbi:hypothetical protein [Amycolatopsis sp. RTGN1]|uniref:hypothetical protein n=1 Tax=Amycolatopsis ponsaeliensis TaxID=2992142 RepID=UPI00254BBA66|nr:hypothetical protein [Amycolatopsis sp. RTGN1]
MTMASWVLATLMTVAALPAAIVVLLVARTRRANQGSSPPPRLQLSKPQTRLLAEQIAVRNERRRALDPEATEILFPPWLIPASSDDDADDGPAAGHA